MAGRPFACLFAIGGDEFLAILQGHDLQHASELNSSLTHINEQNAQTGNVVIAWGISEYHSDEDVATVFERADAAM
ncbi:MAG: diguanylate cyclase, partial [Atopobiaceae bacterium]|nr:diguanylate cyclase [Atopobiaceae bacterium]